MPHTPFGPGAEGERPTPGSNTPQPPPKAEPGRPGWVDMRRQGARGWYVAIGLCGYLTVGLTVLAVVVGVTTGEVVATLVLGVLAVLLGLITWPLARMGPRYSTRQGLLADDTGITLVQEPKRWFPGRAAHIPWTQVREVGQDVVVATTANGRATRYFVHIRLREPLGGAEPPTWALLDGDGIRIQLGKAKHAEVVGALRAPRPDLFRGD